MSFGSRSLRYRVKYPEICDSLGLSAGLNTLSFGCWPVKCSALEIVGLSDVGFNAQHFACGSVRCWVLKLNVGLSDVGF